MNTTILIPARGGSKRVPRKGLQVVGGKTLIARAIETALNAAHWNFGIDNETQVLFASDDEEMLKESSFGTTSHRAMQVHLQKEIASGENGVPEVCKWVATHATLDPLSACIVIQPTSPFMCWKDDLLMVIDAMNKREETGIESVVSVTVEGNGYRRNGAIYATLGKHWRNGLCVAGPTLFHVMPPERSIDIDTMEDLAEARRIAGDAP